MNTILEKTLKHINLGDVQTFHTMAVFPILGNGNNGPTYITLGAALTQGFLKVEEISERGSVPEVLVTNSGDVPVLLLDGEEIVGAKQNRVLNTTILLQPMSKTVVNVSCTEQGRWAYESVQFQDSGVVMPRNIRARKNRSVSASLEHSVLFQSDQGEIWDEIETLCETEGVSSRTGAMRDVYEKKHLELESCIKAFSLVDNQCGLVFLVDRAVIGMDFVSQTSAYADIHPKLIKSYVIDARPRNVDVQREPSSESVHQFIEQMYECSEKSFSSLGLGTDYRYERSEICGSALVYDDTCIHAAFFSNVPFEEGPEMRGFRQRRRFRR